MSELPESGVSISASADVEPAASSVAEMAAEASAEPVSEEGTAPEQEVMSSAAGSSKLSKRWVVLNRIDSYSFQDFMIFG
jgi:hypothetical protein